MKRWSILLAVLLPLSCGASTYEPRTGDVVFQISLSDESLAIRKATHSRYSHVGIVLVRDGWTFVLEAVEPVRLLPLDEWVARGEREHFVAKRLVASDERVTEESLARALEIGEDFVGRHYDPDFDWSDERMYCSELVWKVLERGLGVEVGEPQRFGDLDLSDPVVEAKLRERWGDSPPLDAMVVSPEALFASPLLVTVHAE